MSASFQAICRPLGFSWTRENQQLNINDTDVGSSKQNLGFLTLLALLCSGNSSEFYYLDELYGNELVFVLGFVSSNNTDVETAEQFILLYKRYMFVISLLPTLDTRRKKLCRTLFSSRLADFLAFDPRRIRWCFPLKEVSPQDCLLIPKVSYRTIHPEKLFSWPPVCLLLASEKFVNFFICEDCWLSFCASGVSWRLKWFYIGQFAWIVNFALSMFTFNTHFEKNKIFQRQNCFVFNSHRVSSRAVRISSTCFSGPITSTRTALIRDLFFLMAGFPRKLRAGPYGSYDNIRIFTRIFLA